MKQLQIIYFSSVVISMLDYSIVETSSKSEVGNIDKSFTLSSLCPCDMTAGSCDIYCCCDKDCTLELLRTFTCTDGKFDGNQIQMLHDWRCSNSDSFKEFHFQSLFCIQKINSPYLGHYFIYPKDVKDLPTLNDVLTQKNDAGKSSTDALSGDYGTFKFSAVDGYTFGQYLEIHIVASGEKKRRKMTFPFSMFNEECFLNYPIQFLQDMTSNCAVKVRSVCDVSLTNPFLSAKAFVDGNNTGKYILQSPSVENSFVEINVTYSYVVDPCCYIKSRFCPLQTNCTKIPALPPMMEQDDPIFLNNICNRAILEVQYNFTWKDAKILSLNVTIILGNISLAKYETETSSVLFQRFSVSYNHLYSSDDCVDNCSSNSYYTRSGNPGYELGYPIITAKNLAHQEHPLDNCFPKNKTFCKGHIYLAKQDVFGECTLNDPVNFGHDRMSGCIIRFDLSDFVNCSYIRHQVMVFQSQVLQVDMISKGGDPDFDDEDDFLTVVQEDNLLNITDDDETSPLWLRESGSCSSVPHHVQLHVIYTEADRIRKRPVYKIVGAIRRYQLTRWKIHCGENSRCLGNVSIAFPLTGSVHFSFVSSQRNNKTKRFWTQEVRVGQCKEETCWEEIMYPLTSSFTLHDIYQVANYILLIMLFLVPAIILKL